LFLDIPKSSRDHPNVPFRFFLFQLDYLTRLQEEQIVAPNGTRISVESNMLQHEIIRLCDNVLGFGASVDTTNVIQIVFPQIYRQDGTETALEDGLHLGEMMMLELKLGVLDPISRLLVGVM